MAGGAFGNSGSKGIIIRVSVYEAHMFKFYKPKLQGFEMFPF